MRLRYYSMVFGQDSKHRQYDVPMPFLPSSLRKHDWYIGILANSIIVNGTRHTIARIARTNGAEQYWWSGIRNGIVDQISGTDLLIVSGVFMERNLSSENESAMVVYLKHFPPTRARALSSTLPFSTCFQFEPGPDLPIGKRLTSNHTLL